MEERTLLNVFNLDVCICVCVWCVLVGKKKWHKFWLRHDSYEGRNLPARLRLGKEARRFECGVSHYLYYALPRRKAASLYDINAVLYAGSSINPSTYHPRPRRMW